MLLRRLDNLSPCTTIGLQITSFVASELLYSPHYFQFAFIQEVGLDLLGCFMRGRCHGLGTRLVDLLQRLQIIMHTETLK